MPRRAEFGNPAIYGDLEWLAGLMAEMDRRAGLPAISSALIPRFIESGIRVGEAKLRVFQAMRTVTLAPPETVTVAPSTVAPGPAE